MIFLNTEGYDHYIRCGVTDMRLGCQALASLVQDGLGMDVFRKSVFLFCGNRGRTLKALVWDSGFVLYQRRLCGGTFRWPGIEAQARGVGWDDLQRILRGEDVFRRLPVQEGGLM